MNQKKSFEYYLAVLGLTLQTTKKEIRKAYYQLIKKWHPDKFPNDKLNNAEATEKSKLINDAYHNLRDFSPNFANEYTEEVRVNSSNIYSIRYDKLRMSLQIKFRNGGIYEYRQVPEIIFNELLNSKSKGRYATTHIFNYFHFERVG